VPAVITFLSDYGSDDEFAGVCHAVIARIAPEARVIDLTHGVPRHDVRAGALMLRNALPYAPAGVHLAVVDPAVGSERRPVAVRTAEDDRLLVGPDNGLLIPAAERLGGVVEAADVTHSPFRLEPVSATFHGRDIFAPVAARLAAGAALAEAGDPLDPGLLEPLHLPRPERLDGVLVAHVLAIDRFGNATLDVAHEDIGEAGLRLGREVVVETGGAERRARYVRTFVEVPPGELMLYEDSARMLALAVNRGDAAAELGLARDGEVRIAPEPA
jgi:S-adenosylmethionine hydrolase